MAGGKGGSQTTSVEIPQYIEDAARRNLAKADQLAQIGNVVNPGPTSTAFTPMQSSAFQNTADMANAFGMNAPVGQANIQRGGMDEAEQYANGVRGYSSTPIYDQSMEAFGVRDPGQQAFIDSMFLDKQSGQLAYTPSNYGSAGDPFAGGSVQSEFNRSINASDPNQRAMDAALGASRSANPAGVYRGFGDMMDGGGPGASTRGGRDFAGPNPDGSAGNDGPNGGFFGGLFR
tara:strand:+ start:3561 stop:4256 length:696 start_codon:yes stop_codon:yes gene_type:complete